MIAENIIEKTNDHTICIVAEEYYKKSKSETDKDKIAKRLNELGVPIKIKKVNPYELDNYSRIVSTKRVDKLAID